MKYKQLKDIKLQDILALSDTFFKTKCITHLLECRFIEKIEKGVYHKGQKFKERQDGIYMLAQVNHAEMCLISINDSNGDAGNHWTSPIRVEDSNCVTEQELKKMSGSCGKFELIQE